jgi:hypothetical protein
LAAENPDVAELSTVLSAEKLGWGELCKAYEIHLPRCRRVRGSLQSGLDVEA